MCIILIYMLIILLGGDIVNMDDIKLYIEGFAFIYNVDVILECINDNKNIFKNDEDLKHKLNIIIERFGQTILFEDGTYINTDSYI